MRQRAHSLDAGALLKGTVPSLFKDEPEFAPERPRQRTSTGPSLLGPRSSVSISSGPTLASDRPTSGSIALRAMRSVRSLARIGSWAQLRSSADDHDDSGNKKDTQDIMKEKKAKTRPTPISIRSNSSSGSSFEAGRLTPVKKYIPSTLGRASTCAPHMGTVRTVSTQSTNSTSSNGSYGNSSKRTSGTSILSNGTIVAGRSSKRSSNSSVSVRWTDQNETVKERRIRELEFEQQLEQLDTRRFADPSRRPGVQSLFPGNVTLNTSAQVSPVQPMRPILTLQIATPEKQDPYDQSPVRPARPRPRPVSDQSPVRSRRHGVVINDDRKPLVL